MTGYDNESRGALRRAAGSAVDLRSLRPARRKSWQDVGLWQLEGATDFSGDPVLSDPVGLIAAFRASAAGTTLAELTDATQASIACVLGGRPSGRPRMLGDWPAAYLGYVLSRCPALQPWWTSQQSSEIWKVCGFDHAPVYSEVSLRFAELEKQWTAFATVAEGLIRRARDVEPRIGQIVMVDATQWLTAAKLEHCCPEGACPNPRNALSYLGGDHAAALKAHWDEDDAPEPDGDHENEQTRRDLITIRGVRGDDTFQRFVVGDCWYRSRDVTSGLRKYTGSSISWFGGYLQTAADLFTGASLAVEVFPADVQEWDHYPELFSSVVSALGEAPYAVSVDRGYSIRSFFEFNTRRGVAVVAPLRNRKGRPTLADWRTNAYDEDGIPRCQACGGEGHQDGPGLGLILNPGEPRIQYRCAAPVPELCKGLQSIPCSSEWALLLPLSRKTELYHSIAYAHSNMERVFRHARDRYGVAGKDKSQRLRRAGVEAQRLRSWASVLLDWFRLCIRQGWIEAPRLGGVYRPGTPKLLSGTQDLESGDVMTSGVGTKALGDLVARRHDEGLSYPYGPAWETMRERLKVGITQ